MCQFKHVWSVAWRIFLCFGQNVYPSRMFMWYNGTFPLFCMVRPAAWTLIPFLQIKALKIKIRLHPLKCWVKLTVKAQRGHLRFMCRTDPTPSNKKLAEHIGHWASVQAHAKDLGYTAMCYMPPFLFWECLIEIPPLSWRSSFGSCWYRFDKAT